MSVMPSDAKLTRVRLKLDLQLISAFALDRHMGIERLPHGLKCLFQGVEQFWTVGD